MSQPPVHGVLGAFEIPERDYQSMTSAEKVEYCGIRNYTVVNWDDYPVIETAKASPAAGMMLGLMDRKGKIFPVVFVRSEVHLTEVHEEHREEIAFTYRLIVLLHEYGHAQDLMQKINFDHQKKTIKRAEAEAYAHCYAMHYARNANYRLALQQYIIDLDLKIAETNEDAGTRVGLSVHLRWRTWTN